MVKITQIKNNLNKKKKKQKKKTNKMNSYGNNNNNNNNSNNSNIAKKHVGGGPKKCMCIDYEKKDNIYTNYFDGKQCTRLAVNGTDFCDKHQDCMGFVKSFTNNFEVPYEPDKWNKVPEILNSHNCYTYFLNNQVKPVMEKCRQYFDDKIETRCGKLKPQPGDASELLKNGTLKLKDYEYTCSSMLKKVIADNPSITPIKFNQKCPNGSYKGALVVDPNNTFHFYRQNKDGTWSHKPGILKVADKDAAGEKIYFPHLADRNYKKNNTSGLNYTDFCNYLCVPTNTSNVKLFSI